LYEREAGKNTNVSAYLPPIYHLFLAFSGTDKGKQGGTAWCGQAVANFPFDFLCKMYYTDIP
jgi:hypothetical protein